MPVIRRIRHAVRRAYRPKVDLSHPRRSPLGSSVINAVVYEDGRRRPCDGTAADALRQVRKRGRGFVWVGLHEPTDLEFAVYAETFGLHPLAVEDAVHAHQRPKVERYGDTLFAVFKTCVYVAHEELTATSEVVDTGELMVFTGPDFVITVRHGRHGSLGPLRENLESSPQRLARGPGAVLHAIADQVVDDYLAVADAVQEDVDAVENVVFSERSQRGDSGRIYQLKRELLELRRAAGPLERPLLGLATRPEPPVDPDMQPYFRDVVDHLVRLNEQIAGYDGLLDSILQAHLAQVTVVQNADMRKITAWAAIIAVPTMVCGVYGMNFEHMPELKWRYGYPLVLGIMAAACVVIHRSFRRNGWL
ncbi:MULTISPECIES: magnesium and cobalt transport protein CorA [Streptomyces]|uniref:Magnesium and cobalt transport protein CorA n=1 Tax=Streptomyces tsukubensis (strain DSM 42081 / NBRC 108919 / NRRL 18488 / 9993) TaxID=1114943 RepID=I2N2H1_STRT9|nr:magnesium and cobalt transport protein CorA [Streptomyces tsukubensis]MYS62878.1 magnesium transporter CorA [Streptomyces sp. SID5473]AZK95340.1 magnesium transporter CorA [Streptomyces tsukubensis]EIF91218.1 metal-transport protein [Streptomyces tsukubensis NRRL18488]QKM68610.1 magnesium and cobalt transport protein CorA [Streptomyces tsukubensis NRRL18488]TAI43417.1 magnesium and cobalt transport protein CorA [Streptomyces tsukubensis]